MGQIPKSSALYIFRPETSELCGECAFLKPKEDGKDGCAFFGAGEDVSATKGSCGYWSHAKPGLFQVDWMGIFTKAELGYTENSPGFGCFRCEYFGFGKDDCELVDKDSAGDNPGQIHPRACCSLWEADDERGNLTADKLQEMMSK